MLPQDLSGQVAIITGASSGIGRAVAGALAAAGAAVVVNYPPSKTSGDKAATVVGEIETAGGKAIAIAADVSKEDEVEAMVAETVRAFRHAAHHDRQCRHRASPR